MLQRLLVPILLAGALAAPAAADDGSRYSEWRPDGAEAEGGAALEALARELEALIDEAENARAADPHFLQDLRDKIAAHVADAEPRSKSRTRSPHSRRKSSSRCLVPAFDGLDRV